jgi:hypothetical protein
MRHSRSDIQLCPTFFLNAVLLGGVILLLLMPTVSADENWSQVTAGADWSARAYFSSVVMPDGSIVLMGGSGSNDPTKEVWRSTDSGATWKLQTGDAGLAGKYFETAVALPDGSIVIMGCTGGTVIKNDVWRSTDKGVTWTQMTTHPGWTQRIAPGSVVMPDGSIIISGGTLPGGFTQYNDVWRSTDKGATWTQQTPSAGWSKRYGHSIVALPDGSLVLAGGFTFGQGFLNDVWRSTDNGVTWTQVTPHAGWSGRYYHNSIVMPDGSILLLGGGDRNINFKNDLWRSADNGATWTQVSPDAGWSARQGQMSGLLPDGSIVLMGGYDGQYRNDVWKIGPAELSGILQPGITGHAGTFVISKNTTIVLSKTITPHVIKQGTDAVVTITLTNAGLTQLHDIELLDESRPEFPETAGRTRSMTAQMLMPNETRILRYTISATKPGTYTFNGTSVMFAGEDGNYHLVRSNAPTVSVLEPLISPPDQPFDPGRAVSDFFREIFP